jgi:hypothetical protein
MWFQICFLTFDLHTYFHSNKNGQAKVNVDEKDSQFFSTRL